jgi:hypothetical protein
MHTIQYELIAKLYGVADDHEASVLDDLQRRAGFTWDHVGCWTNETTRTKCERCGVARASLEPGVEVLP